MGNEAIALGAIHAGVGVVAGYPGTPSTEILETIAKRNPGDIHVEWSVNEKVALEVAAGAAYAGARALATMKQVGLNVASDPLMSLAYVGVKGGLVVVAADDPGPNSSQTEQDTRHFALFAKLPVFDPSSPEEAYEMIGDAFACSEKYGTPVLLRPTTRVCHGYAPVDLGEGAGARAASGFEKHPRWVIFPRLTYENKLQMNARRPVIAQEFSGSRFNAVTPSGQRAGSRGVACGGVSYAYVRDALALLGVDCRLLKVGTPHPFPEQLAREFLGGLDEVLVVEELDPVIERELLILAGRFHLPVDVRGKLSGHMAAAGENSVDAAAAAIADLLGVGRADAAAASVPTGLAERSDDAGVGDDVGPDLPVRPPVLCGGCPHRASFYAVKQAMRRRKAVFCGDIGCYTLGNAKPLEMVDTCLCMGAGITIAQGLAHAEPDAVHFAFVGDSTFFHSGIPGVINALYNGTRMVLVVLDNSTTAMTGGQPHPGIGTTMMGTISDKIPIARLLEGLGVRHIETCDPLQLDEARAAVERAVAAGGVSAIIFQSPCINIVPPKPLYAIDQEVCTVCRSCIKRLGCPAISLVDGQVCIDAATCWGCSICAQVCPHAAIKLVTT